MASDNELLIKITAETKEALKAIGGLNDELDDLVKQEKKHNKEGKKTETQNKKTSKSYKNIGIGLKSVVASLLAMGVATKAIEFEKLAEDAEQSSEAFKLLFEDMGLVAEEEFAKIKEASKGLVDEASLRQSAVTAASLGVPIEKLSELMEVARVKAREMGTDASSAFNDLATGIGRGSPMILDNLGLTIKLGEANQKMADELNKSVESLTKQEKAMALTNAVIEAGKDSIERYADAGLSAAQKSQKLNAQLDDLKIKIGQGLIPLMDKLKTSSIDWLEEFNDEGIKKVTDRLLTVGQTLQKVNDYLVPDIGQEGRGFFDTIAGGYGKLIDQLEKYNNMEDANNFGDSLEESGEGINEFIKSLALLGNEGDTYGGKLKNVQSAYSEQEKTLNSLLETNLKLKDYFVNTDPSLFREQIRKLSEDEQTLLDQSIQLSTVQATLFKSETTSRVDEHTEAVRLFREEFQKYKEDTDGDNYTIKPKVELDDKKSFIEIKDSLNAIGESVEIKPRVKVDEKEIADKLDESIKNAINQLGENAKITEISVAIDKQSEKQYIDTMDSLTKPQETEITLNLDETSVNAVDTKRQELSKPITIDVIYNYVNPGGASLTPTLDSLADEIDYGIGE